MPNPTHFEQEMLEILNRARLNPAGEFDKLILDETAGTGALPGITNAIRYFGVDLAAFKAQLATLDPVAPLAWNDNLAQAAQTHSGLVIDFDTQSHRLPGEAGLGDRITEAGYLRWNLVGENIFAYSESVLQSHAGFYIDWGYDDEDILDGSLRPDWQDLGDGMQDPAGHRRTILNETYSEVGIAAVPASGGSVGPYVVTQNFGARSSAPKSLVGVVFSDIDGDGDYDGSEGESGVTFRQSSETTANWNTGGYQIAASLTESRMDLTVSGLSGQEDFDLTVTMDDENAKLDFVKDVDGWVLRSSADLELGALGTASMIRGLEMLGPDDLDLTGPSDVSMRIEGNQGNNRLTGGDATNDTLLGHAGNDTLSGLGGNDSLDGGSGNDSVHGGTGFDTISAGDGADTVEGGDGRDLVYLNQGNDLFIDSAQGGVNGQDTVYGGYGDDTIQGGNGNDVFHGEWGNDVINARLGNDVVYGGDGSDTISAGEGNDIVFGGDGRDLVFLNQGNDIFFDTAQGGPLGNDTVYTGLGDDTVHGGNGDDVFFGEDGNDVIRARLGNDTVYGGANFDFIDAGDGNDLVYGGLGRDTVLLGNGDDRYVDTDQVGDLGRDTITGGAGADTFVFGAVISADVITDFERGTDRLELDTSLAAGRNTAQLVSDFASVTGDGVLIEFATDQSILLQGLTSLTGLEDDISLI